MTVIQHFLAGAKDIPLISHGGVTETQASFVAMVDGLVDKLSRQSELRDNQVVLLYQEEPIAFYALMFALWENGNRVIFPSRDILNDPKSTRLYEYLVYLNDAGIQVQANPDANLQSLPADGNSVIFSSGSTGPPKGILHEHHHYLDNSLATRQAITESEVTSLTFLKPYLVSAISHFLVHFLTDSYLMFSEFSQVHKTTELFSRHRDLGIVGSPVHLSTGLQFIPEDCQPRMFFSSGDFLSSLSTSRILQTFPDTAVYHVYGLAELAGRFFVHRLDRATPEELYESVGSPIPGTTFECIDSQLFVKSDFLFKGYIRQDGFTPSEKWHPTEDMARVTDSGVFLSGRSNDEIKILGNKVSLKHIENRIKPVLNRELLVVVASEHPSFGNMLSLVVNDESGLSRTEIIAKLRKVLQPFEIPHQYLVMEQFPFTASMKIDRPAIVAGIDSLRGIG